VRLDSVDIQILGNRVEEADGWHVDARQKRTLADGSVWQTVEPVEAAAHSIGEAGGEGTPVKDGRRISGGVVHCWRHFFFLVDNMDGGAEKKKKKS